MLYGIPNMQNLKKKLIQMNLFMKQTPVLENELIVAGGRDSKEVWDGHVHTTVFKMDNQQEPTVLHRELCSVLCGGLDSWGVWGRMDTCICVAESLCCSLKLSQHY